MRQSEFDKINAALDRAEFALEELRKKTDKLRRKQASAKTPEEIMAVNMEASELDRQLQKISDALHADNPAPHLRLVHDPE
jgi:predicted  nucleic acid-binding Zn-ribbon protein